MAEAKRPAFNLDISAAAKALNSTPAPTKDAKTAAIAEEDDAEVRAHLEGIWDKHDGNIRDIFEELNEDPGKALKVSTCCAEDMMCWYGKETESGCVLHFLFYSHFTSTSVPV